MLDDIVILSIEDVYTVESYRGRRVQMHDRGSYGISLCYEGQITYTQGGNTVISDRDHMILLPRDRDYALYGDADGPFPVIDVQAVLPVPLEMPTAFRIRNPEVYLKDYEKLRERFFFEKNKAKCMSILYEMLGRAAVDNSGENRVAAAVADYIDGHFCEPGVSNEVIARALNLSEAYFRRQFLEVYGCTPMQYVRELRIRRAKQLLSESKLGVGAIAEQCGYASVYHFSRAFQKTQGLSATAYREIARKVSI